MDIFLFCVQKVDRHGIIHGVWFDGEYDSICPDDTTTDISNVKAGEVIEIETLYV